MKSHDEHDESDMTLLYQEAVRLSKNPAEVVDKIARYKHLRKCMQTPAATSLGAPGVRELSIICQVLSFVGRMWNLEFVISRLSGFIAELDGLLTGDLDASAAFPPLIRAKDADAAIYELSAECVARLQIRRTNLYPSSRRERLLAAYQLFRQNPNWRWEDLVRELLPVEYGGKCKSSERWPLTKLYDIRRENEHATKQLELAIDALTKAVNKLAKHDERTAPKQAQRNYANRKANRKSPPKN